MGENQNPIKNGSKPNQETVADVLRRLQCGEGYMRFIYQSDIDRIAAAHARETEALQLQIDNLEASDVHTCSQHCQRVACVQRREIAALRKDAERLDWIEQNSDGIGLRKQDDGDGGHIYTANIEPTREAIDEAMGAG